MENKDLEGKKLEHRQVMAGAGAGKTERIANLIVDSLTVGTPPDAILATTYGVQAAKELKERILTVAGRRLGPMPGLAQMMVGTIHSVCLALLKRHLPRYSSYRLLSDAQIYLLVRDHYHELGLDQVRLIDGPHTSDPLERSIWDICAYLDVLSVGREEDVDWSRVPGPLKTSCQRYKKLLHRERALDNTGLLHQTLQALENTKDEHCCRLRQYIADTLQEMYVDEYQDVNPIQERLIAAFAGLGVTITVVGDRNQAIYGWRGCDVRYVNSFADRYQASTERLNTNYRSSPAILTAAHQILGSLSSPGDEAAMTPGGHQKAEAGDLQARHFANPREEADYIVHRIQDLLGTPFQDRREDTPRGLSYSDMAVLCRSVRQSAGAIVSALQAAGIPYRVSGLGGLFAAPEVRAVVKSFLYLADRPELIEHGRKHGRKVVDKQMITANDVAQAWQEADLGFSPAGIAAGLTYLEQQKAAYLQQQMNTAEDTDNEVQEDGKENICNLQQLYQDLLGQMHLREEKIPPTCAGIPRGSEVMRCLGALSQVIDKYDVLRFRQPPTQKLANFAEWLQNEAPHFFEDIETSDKNGLSGLDASTQSDAVTICTIHKAKGQEWPAVFVPGLAEGRFPHNGQQYGRTKWHILPRNAVRDAARYDTTLAEEIRLMYVAMTRAKKFLTCTFAPDLTLARPQQMSPFLRTFARCPGVQTKPEEKVKKVQQKLPPMARAQERTLVLTFSQIAAYLRCPYLFKLRTIYGWAAAPGEAEGFGKGNHDALSEVHAAIIAGIRLEGEPAQIATSLIERHLLLPYAAPEISQLLAQAAARQLAQYLIEERTQIAGVTHTEAPFEIVLQSGLTIVGRNDVVWQQNGEETLREIKSRREVQSEEISRTQLYIEDLGFHASMGRHVDYLEAYNMAGSESEPPGVQFREAFDPRQSALTQTHLINSAAAMRRRDLPRLPMFCETCHRCDHPGLCRDKPGAV